MRFRRNEILSGALAFAVAVIAMSTSTYAQFSVTISGTLSSSSSSSSAPLPTTLAAPTDPFTIDAAVQNVPNTLTKVVFYRNDVPYKTYAGSSTSQTLPEDKVGQDTYTYRARAYDSSGTWVDSNDLKLTVETPRVYKMSDVIGGTTTHGPSNNYTLNHTLEIQAAVDYISGQGGGTLYFPCTFPAGTFYGAYNIDNTITVPSNVTLQGESAEETIGRCQILWNDINWHPTVPPVYCYDNPGPLLNKPMFKIAGNTFRVRFRDMWLYSRSSGRDCWPRSDYARIYGENTVGVLIDAGSSGTISDVVFENVAVTNFKYGIKATGYSISDIKMRAYRPNSNYRQLYIDATYAYDWDIQNFSITNMLEQQGAVEIINAGAPVSYTGENKKLKFLQLNCAGDKSQTPGFCVRVEKHGGLYFRQLHHEGVDHALKVENIYPRTNDDPIIFENGVATGEFKDASMKLYLIGNTVAAAPEVVPMNLDDGRLRFSGAGINSTVVDCGDVHWDTTDVDGGLANWADFQMMFTHSERNRSSFFADGNGYSYVKPHTICPAGVPGLSDINRVDGDHFNTGVLPMETILPYTNVFNPANCSGASNCATQLQNLLTRADTNGGTVYIDGSVTVDQTITIPTGRQLVGAPGSELILSTSTPNVELLRINSASPSEHRTAGIVIRNLKLKTTQTGTGTGLAIIGANHSGAGGSSDMHFSGLVIEGFAKGLEVARYSSTTGYPMVDSISWKNNAFVNNGAAAMITSANLSNWNVMNISIESNSAGATGWYQQYGGRVMLQNVMCRGTSNPMTHCLKLDVAGVYLTGLKKTENVTNALTFGENRIYIIRGWGDFIRVTTRVTLRTSFCAATISDRR